MKHRGLAHSGRPGDFQELMTRARVVGFSNAFGEFLDEFYRDPCQQALDIPPPPEISLELEAFLAGTAEALAATWGLAPPTWAVGGPVLPREVIWEIRQGSFPREDEERVRPIIERQTPEAYRRHGILVRASVLNRT